MKNQISNSPEVRERAVRLVLEQQKEHAQRNSVCAYLPIHLKPEFLLGSAYLIAEFLSKLYLESDSYTEIQKELPDTTGLA